ncbi:MAG: right-handed parallel beta-helix repeat-containing protein, partial [Candidatus Thorarchaeota archaeon]
NCSIFNNTFTGCGLRVYGWDMSYWMHSVSGNIVNEKPLLYYKNANGSTIDASQYGQVVLTNCTTVTVVNGTFTQGSGGVWLMYCFDCSVIGNIANSSYTGFTFQRSDYCVLANNTVWNTSAHGFKIWYSGNCTVSNNTVTGSSIGYSIYGSGRNTIEINTARQNGIGFDVGHSYENVFLENSIDQNNEGFSLQLSVACILQNNTFIDDALSIQGYVQNHWEHSILGNTIDGSPLGYFLRENDSIIQASQYGQIILVSANGTRISDGTFQNKPRGIVLAYSDNCRLVNITVAESQSNGYSLYSCVNCTLENSTAFQNVGHGVYSEYSPSCGFANNNASSNSGHGFVLFHSGKSSIVNSRIGGNSEQGIELLHSSNCIVENNTLKDNSLMITGINGSWMHNISGNTIDGAQLGYFRGITNRAFDADEFGQLILVDCHGVIVEDGVLNKTSGGIQLVYCTQVTITRVTVIGSSTHAFFLWDTLSVTLSDNVAADCRGDGFVLVSGTGCSFLNNIANGNERNGYYLGLATGCVLADNTALDNGDSGFVMKGCESCTFEGNTAGRNSNDGFDVYASETLITRNEAHGNGRDGFHLSISESDVMKNVVTENRRYGVYLDSESYGNLLFLNRLGFNGIADAMNNGHATLWHNGGFGNYWGTYDGNGTYSVPGAEESIDFHPYEYYRASPVIDHPDDISYSYEPNGNGTAHAIIWRAWDWGHTAYRIWRDSTLVSAATLHGSHIIIHEIYRELTPGVYNYTVVVTDEEENSISDTVSVTIEWPGGYEPGIFDSTDVHLLLTVVGAVSAVVVIAVLAVEGFEKRS